MEDQTVFIRFALILEAYLRGCGFYMDELIRQNEVISKLADVALSIKRVKSFAERKERLESGLSSISWHGSFSLPLNPQMDAKCLTPNQCRYMDSKKVILMTLYLNHLLIYPLNSFIHGM